MKQSKHSKLPRERSPRLSLEKLYAMILEHKRTQGLCRTLIRKFKEFSRTIYELNYDFSRSFKLKDLEYIYKPKMQQTRNFLVYHQFACTIFFNFLDISFNCSAKQIYVNEEDSEQTEISKSVVNVQGEILICMEFQVPLKEYFKSQHFSRSSRISTNPAQNFIEVKDMNDLT